MIKTNHLVNEIEKDDYRKSDEYQQYCSNFDETIKIPKLIVSDIDKICNFIGVRKDDLFTIFIINGLENFYIEPEEIINIMKKLDGLLERLRQGLNQYYGCEVHKKSSNRELNINCGKSKEIKFRFYIPKLLSDCIDWIAKFVSRSRCELLSYWVIIHIELIYQEPEQLLGYSNNKNGFFEDLRKGLDTYYDSKKLPSLMK